MRKSTTPPVPLLQASPNVTHTVTIDSQHTLLLIGGQKLNYPTMGEYGTNLLYLNSGEPLRLAISENSVDPLPEPLPQSTYDQFARARPERVRNGYDRNSTEIKE